MTELLPTGDLMVIATREALILKRQKGELTDSENRSLESIEAWMSEHRGDITLYREGWHKIDKEPDVETTPLQPRRVSRNSNNDDRPNAIIVKKGEFDHRTVNLGNPIARHNWDHRVVTGRIPEDDSDHIIKIWEETRFEE